MSVCDAVCRRPHHLRSSRRRSRTHLSVNFASRSPLMLPDLLSRTPRTLKTTPLGVLVLTSRVEPLMGLRERKVGGGQ